MEILCCRSKAQIKKLKRKTQLRREKKQTRKEIKEEKREDMVRTPSFDQNGIKKGAWSPEEDRKLQAYISRYGHWTWRKLPKFAGLKRCGKSCRLRWMNYLRPNVKHGNYTREEEDLIMELHEKHGNKWAMIASKLPGRTDNEIKNYWHTQIKKRRMMEKASTTSSDKTQRSSGGVDKSDSESSQKHISNRDASSISHEIVSQDCLQHIQILESCPFSEQMSSAAISLSSSTSTVMYGGFEEVMSSPDHQFFTEFTSPSYLQFDPQMDNGSDSMSGNGEFLEETASMMDVFGELEDDDFWTKPFNVEDVLS